MDPPVAEPALPGDAQPAPREVPARIRALFEDDAALLAEFDPSRRAGAIAPAGEPAVRAAR
jgi:hypothetical protein